MKLSSERTILSALILFSGCHEQEISRKPKKDTSAKKSVPQATHNTVAQLNEGPDIYLEKPKAIDSQPQERSTPFMLNEKPVQKEPISFFLNGESDIDLGRVLISTTCILNCAKIHGILSRN